MCAKALVIITAWIGFTVKRWTSHVHAGRNCCYRNPSRDWKCKEREVPSGGLTLMQHHHSPHGLGCKTVLNTCFITLILRKMENANGHLIQTHRSRKKTSKKGKTIVCDTVRLLYSNKLVFRVAGKRHQKMSRESFLLHLKVT